MNKKLEARLLELFAVDGNGHVHLRVIISAPETLNNAVSPQSSRTLNSLIERSIGTAEDGKPALRLATASIE